MSLLHSKKRTPMLLFCIIFVLCIVTSEGTGGCVARYHSGTGTNIIVLEYTVKDGDSSPRLDYRISPKSLVAQNTEGGRLPVLGYVRRKSTAPITDANLDLLHLTGMADRHIIVIDGERPRMMDVSFDEEVKGQVLGKGDILKILIRFSSPVVIDQSLPPTLSLFVGDKERWADYTSGSGTTILRFNYQIIVGDSAAPLGVKYRRLCQYDKNCESLNGLIMRLSEAPSQNANLDQGFSDQGIEIAASASNCVTVDTSGSSTSTVESVTTLKAEGTYGPGEIFDIQIKFSDQVYLSGRPSLLLNINSEASYYAGDETNTLIFRFISTISDSIDELDWVIDPTTDSAVNCNDACAMKNGNGEEVDIRFFDSVSGSTLIDPLPIVIAIDPTSPRIVSIKTDKGKSPYCYQLSTLSQEPVCAYSSGEQINITVTFNRPIIVMGNDVSLPMDVGDDAQGKQAFYVPSSSSEYDLVFQYTVNHGHSSNGDSLSYECTEILCSLRLGANTKIKAAATHPIVDADLTLLQLDHRIISGESNPIIIDTSGYAEVIAISSSTPNGKYSPGDIIEVVVEFSRIVVVSGEPFIALEVGSNQAGRAVYKGGSGSFFLLFEYEVGIDHMTQDLEYIDAHSLYLGFDGVKSGTIRQASSNPTIDAILHLPTPGTNGSLGSNADLKIDSKEPYISMVSSTPGHYVTGDEILIQLHFSRPVSIDGRPSLILGIGNNNRVAEFKSQPQDQTITFSYTVKLGDITDGLDYWSDEELYPSSKLSFQVNGGWIKLTSLNPILDADVHLNPIDGFLAGEKSCVVNEGVAKFRDLKIGQRGDDFKIWYQAIAGDDEEFEVAEIVMIDLSIEYELRGDLNNRDPGDGYGTAVSIHNNLLAVGAPRKRNPIHEVQVLTVYSETTINENEVQIITTSVNRDQAIISSQEFSTCADAGETIRGKFKLTFIHGIYVFASSIEFDSDVTAYQLKTILETELNMVGFITTSRSENISCESKNSWKWSVTFSDSSTGVGILETNGDALVANGALISNTVITRDVDMLRGSFIITNPSNGLRSRQLPYDAPAALVKDAIENDILIAVMSVQVENMDPEHDMPELGRRWTIIFSHHVGDWGSDMDIPRLHVSGDGLFGKDALVWTHVGFEGRGVLSGHFAMAFRGSSSCYFIPYDSSSEEISKALESLDSINKVSVSDRKEFSDEVGRSGFSWAITFESVNKLTEYGWLVDYGGTSSNGNLPTLEVLSHLIGWKANYFVESETGRGRQDTQSQWMEKQMGDDGSGSGSVDVYKHVRESWIKEATILASDYNSHDLFGASISIHDNYLLIGAASKRVDGLPEQQKMTCTGPANGGFFFVLFRGFKSSPIPYDATLPDIQSAIMGVYGDTTQIQSTPQLIFSSGSNEWDGISDGFCEGNQEKTISITFLRSGDVEAIEIDFSSLVGGVITVSESRVGTVAPMGKDLNKAHPTGKQSGSAYLYERHLSCSYCFPKWNQIMKFTPLDGFDDTMDAAEFGQSVVFVPQTGHMSKLAIVGSPGFNRESGKVYIFHVDQGKWKLFDTLTDQNWINARTSRGRFGSSLDADSDTILVGSPGDSNGKGAVYCFQQSENGKPFLASQAIYGPNIDDGDNFGHSISLSGNKAVICAPQKTANVIHVGVKKFPAKRAGACYVYFRTSQSHIFKLEQQLSPSNTLAGDQFGWSVAMSGSRIVVGQMEKFSGNLGPPRPVQTIKTICEIASCSNAAGSTFRLFWMEGEISRWTPFLPSNISANRLRDIIETSLHTGQISVSRSVLSDKDGGHSWQVTFDSYRPFYRDENKIPAITCETSPTSSLSCGVNIDHDIPCNIRSKAHLFDFNDVNTTWIEQAFLFPSTPQRQDTFGASVALYNNYAVVGAPNRELLNVNNGAALVYDTSFLDLKFDGHYSVSEGRTLDIVVTRSLSNCRQLIALRTMDRNAENDFHAYVNELYTLRSFDLNPYDKTSVDLLTGNSAFGRNQYYGSNEKRSRWIYGMFDIQGINDYELLDYKGQFKQGVQSISTSLRTNDDSILEADESVTIQINLKGMFASQLGRLKTDVKITDSGDGAMHGRHGYYHFLDGKNYGEMERMGAAVDTDRVGEMIIVGSDQQTGVDANGKLLKNVGSARIFEKTSEGWVLTEHLTPPREDIKQYMAFGASVAIEKMYGRDHVTVLVGAPGNAAVYVYVQHSGGAIQQAKLVANDAILSSEHRFGGPGAIALNGDVAFVGCSLMETVYIFRRSYVPGKGFVKWESYSNLRSSDFDFDVYGQAFSVKHMHRQEFGATLAANQRSLIVSAPFADYGNQGDVNVRENVETDGVHNKGLGKGKVYAFYSQPHIQVVSLQSDDIISSGSFRLKLSGHLGFDEDVSALIRHDATPDTFKEALESMMTVGEVYVEMRKQFDTKDKPPSYKISWRVSFISNVADNLPTLIPLWHDNGCNDCIMFKVSVLSEVEPYITVKVTHSHRNYIQEGELQPRDVTSTDLFGSSIALDGPQSIIGSMYSSTKTRTTWDFETGDLSGWVATGDAFRFQPTFGDNSKHRAVYEGYGNAASLSSGESQRSGLRGRYYVGTFEKRSSDENYQVPSDKFGLGSTQGDGPTGTLTSDPFMILGETISFLIGGGCNHLTVYIELLVDGFPSLRATGKCSERMERITWDVDMFKTRSGQIRIVDNGSNKWDHINVDQIEFSWDVHGTCLVNNSGECTEGGGAMPKSNIVGKQHYTGREESAMSGAAYIFLRDCALADFEDFEYSAPSNSNCDWVEQERISASDKREGNLFGMSVDIDDKQGIAIVGSPNSPAYGFYQEPVFLHPHSNLTTIGLPISEDLEDLMKSGTTRSATGGNIRLIDYLIDQNQIPVKDATRFTEQAGATYVFIREQAQHGPSGEVIRKPFWRTTENGKIAPPDVAARDNFGFSVVLAGTTAVMGATGSDTHANNGGGAFVFDMEWVRVKFSEVEFVALEGSDHLVKIFVQRDLAWSNSLFSIGYSTSDLSAIGVDTSKFDTCVTLHASERDGCGDYEQTSGEVSFDPGEEYAYFTIRIMNDLCTERNMEYVQLNLHQLGGSPIRGEQYRSQLRIDDDDWQDDVLSMRCKGGIS